MDQIRAAFVKQGGGVVELRLLPKPKIEENSILVMLKSSGICGTDLEKISGGGITSPILGHEVSGLVTESASDRFRKGDRVIPHHHVACGECELCEAGADTMCQKFKSSHFSPGGFADEFLVPAYNVERGAVYKIPDDLSFDEASFAEPLGCCIRGQAHSGIFESDSSKKLRNALIVGAGPIGLLHMEVLRSQFPDIIISAVDMLETRLQFAEKNENARVVNAAKTVHGTFSEESKRIIDSSEGYDLVIVATGSEKAFTESIKCVRKSGKVLLFGVPHKGASHNLDLADLLMDELTITSSFATSEKELKLAIELLEERKIDVNKFVTSRYPLEKIDEAFSAARSEKEVKVLVTA
jgi:L-iditol 2-dehydrogenase